VLRERSSTVSGILNGVDYDEWSPEKDRFIAQNYAPAQLEGKQACKHDLLQQFGISAGDSDLPVIGIVSRFAEQKGFDLIAEIGADLAGLPLIVTALGTGDRKYEDLFRHLNKEQPGKFAVRIGYDDSLSHKIEAGADMFLMPSRYEPCGLNQMYSLKYGTVPVVHATGGLEDTIDQWDPSSGQGTGFKFSNYSSHALLTSLREALQAFRDKVGWKKLMLNGMSKDFSWNASAKEYVKIYEHLQGSSRTPTAKDTKELEEEILVAQRSEDRSIY